MVQTRATFDSTDNGTFEEQGYAALWWKYMQLFLALANDNENIIGCFRVCTRIQPVHMFLEVHKAIEL